MTEFQEDHDGDDYDSDKGDGKYDDYSDAEHYGDGDENHNNLVTLVRLCLGW